ncbi:hypothetical protein NXF77_27010, partial [Klebsiella pneumoniae]|nr:hypothetical protein [Klebsiella pneumoniae]
MGSCAAPSAKGDDKFITTDYLQQCRHEQPDCQEGRFPPGTGMNVRLRRPFFSPAFSVYDLPEITSPSL